MFRRLVAPLPATSVIVRYARTKKLVEVGLLQNVANLGKKGQLVQVSPGFARNYLLTSAQRAVRIDDSNQANFVKPSVLTLPLQ